MIMFQIPNIDLILLKQGFKNHFQLRKQFLFQQFSYYKIKIMDDNAPEVKNIQKYHDHFRNVAQTIRVSPKKDRTCNDKLCYIVFILITAVFIGLGIFFMRSSDIRDIMKAAIKNEQYSQYAQKTEQLQGFNFENLKPGIPIIAGMMAFTVVMAALFLCLLVKFPKCIFVSMLIFGFLLIGAITALLFYIGALVPAIIICVLMGILLLVLCCTYKKIKTGIALLNIASKFLAQMPSTFLAPIFILIFIITFEVFWAMSLAGITLYNGNAQTQSQIAQQKQVNAVIGFFWTFFNLFYSFFFYYCISFLIATAAGIWYYNLNESYLPKGVTRILRFHLGSFTFASILVSIVSLTRQYSEKQAREGCGVSTVVVCMLGCCIKCMEDLLETLNHNAIIVMSVTGQSYFDSARSALSLVFENFPLFFLVDLMSHMVTITGVVFICGLPALIGFILLRATAQNSDDTTTQIVGTVIILLFGMLVGGVFLSVLSEALSCMFIFFCLDRKFTQMGYTAPEQAPEAIKKIFQQLVPYVGGQYNQHYDTQRKPYEQPQNIQSNQQGYYPIRNQPNEPTDIHQEGGFF